MKIYQWNKVLCDYTCGTITVIAESVEQARDFIKQKYYIDNPPYPPYWNNEMGRTEWEDPVEIEIAAGVMIEAWGSA